MANLGRGSVIKSVNVFILELLVNIVCNAFGVQSTVVYNFQIHMHTLFSMHTGIHNLNQYYAYRGNNVLCAIHANTHVMHA